MEYGSKTPNLASDHGTSDPVLHYNIYIILYMGGGGTKDEYVNVKYIVEFRYFVWAR